MTLPSEVQWALDQPEVTDPAALRAHWTAPFRLTVVGIVGVGKTTLANRLTGQGARTGLGGITRGVQPLFGPERVVLDTEGIDDVRVARAVLAEPLSTADAIVWVLDGRSPSTASERTVVTELARPGTPVHVVVARADLLDPGEQAQVLARIQLLHARAASTTALDLRTGPLPTPLLDTTGPSPVRVHALAAALTDARTRVPDAPTADAFLHELRRAWRSTVHSVRDAILADVRAGTLADATVAVESLVRAGQRAHGHVRLALRGDPFLQDLGVAAPSLPQIEADQEGPLHALVSGMGGQAGATRAVNAAAGRWLSEGDLQIMDWQADTLEPALATRAARLTERRERYTDAIAAIPGPTPAS